MLARARGVPMVVGLGVDLATLAGRRAALVDGERGDALCSIPQPATRADFDARARRGAARADARGGGVPRRGRRSTARRRRRSPCSINIADRRPNSTRSIPPICDGVGLVRTEFLFDGDGAARRGDAVSRLSRASSNGRRAGR